MRVRECARPVQRAHDHNTHQLTKGIQVSQGHRAWEEDLLLSVTGLSIDSMKSLNSSIDAAMARLENGLLDIAPLRAEQKALFFGGKNV